MQIKLTTDYAIRIVLYLATHTGLCAAPELSDAMGVPVSYIPKIVKDLRNAGIIYSATGGNGGHALAKKPADISMRDLILSTEKTIRINRCLEDDGFCSRNGVENHCPVHDYYTGLQTLIDGYLQSTTVADILSGNIRPKVHVD